MITNNFVSSLQDPLRNNLATRGPKTLLQVEQLLTNDFQYLNNQSSDSSKQLTKRLPNVSQPRTFNNRFPTGPININNNRQQQYKVFAPKQN